ncbi:MAG: flavodoxin family protein [Syntrophomonadaceae bacterium]|nr:flavodoxin family protein [Syntrophomonadaceae bacterium]
MNHITDYRPLIIGINGSPNKEGNTSVLLGEALKVCTEMGAEVELIRCSEALKGLKAPFCTHCQSPCQSRCAEGKPLEKALQSLGRADGIIIGSPVYFGTVSGQLKAFWDKTRSLRSGKRLLNVVGGAIAVGGSPYGGQETAVQAIHHMMLVHGMLVVGDGYIDDDCGHLGAMANRPALEDVHALERVEVLAKRVVQVARATRNIRVGRG